MSDNAMLRPRTLLIAAMIVVAAASRLAPHAWNFTPVEAMALFGGAMFADRRLAFLVPLGAMLASDALLGFHAMMPVVYGCIALSVALGFWLRERRTPLRIAAAGLAGSLLFFVITNGVLWLTGGTSFCQTGLVECYVAALPFLRGWVAGTAVWSVLLFGGFALLRHYAPRFALTTRSAPALSPAA